MHSQCASLHSIFSLFTSRLTYRIYPDLACIIYAPVYDNDATEIIRNDWIRLDQIRYQPVSQPPHSDYERLVLERCQTKECLISETCFLFPTDLTNTNHKNLTTRMMTSMIMHIIKMITMVTIVMVISSVTKGAGEGGRPWVQPNEMAQKTKVWDKQCRKSMKKTMFCQ